MDITWKLTSIFLNIVEKMKFKVVSALKHKSMTKLPDSNIDPVFLNSSLALSIFQIKCEYEADRLR